MALSNIQNTVDSSQNLTNLEQIDSFYVMFDPTRDIITNKSKLYYEQIVPQQTVLTSTCGISETLTNGQEIYTCSYNSKLVFTGCKVDSTSILYTPIQSLLRSDYENNNVTDWVPISGSSITSASNYVTLLSFANDGIGDKLSFGLAGNEFQLALGSTTYIAKPAKNYSGVNYNIKSQFRTDLSNFGIIFESGSSTNIDDAKGIFLGQLGLIMFYGETTGDAPVLSGVVAAKNIIREQRLNSKTYFCRITNEKFNASSNPTWGVYDEELGYTRVRNIENNFTAITTIGLYNDNNELLAVAKLSEPVLKQNDTQLHPKVVLQY